MLFGLYLIPVQYKNVSGHLQTKISADRPQKPKFCFPAPRPSCGAFVSPPAAGAWASAPNLLTTIPALFEKWGTRGHQSAFLAHFTYESLLWHRKTGTGAGVDVI